LYYITIEEMNFTILETLRALRVEKWIHAVKQWFLNATPIENNKRIKKKDKKMDNKKYKKKGEEEEEELIFGWAKVPLS
jgi:hypothetical protein